MARIAPTGAPEAPRTAVLASALAWPASAPPPVEAETGALPPNPALRTDPELGLVVLEFRNAGVEVAASVPTSRELDAYRRAARTGAPRPTA